MLHVFQIFFRICFCLLPATGSFIFTSMLDEFIFAGVEEIGGQLRRSTNGIGFRETSNQFFVIRQIMHQRSPRHSETISVTDLEENRLERSLMLHLPFDTVARKEIVLLIENKNRQVLKTHSKKMIPEHKEKPGQSKQAVQWQFWQSFAQSLPLSARHRHPPDVSPRPPGPHRGPRVGH